MDDQLLRYASWRDTKTAIFLFNRGRALTSVLSKISPTISGHDNFVRQMAYGEGIVGLRQHREVERPLTSCRG